MTKRFPESKAKYYRMLCSYRTALIFGRKIGHLEEQLKLAKRDAIANYTLLMVRAQLTPAEKKAFGKTIKWSEKDFDPDNDWPPW